MPDLFTYTDYRKFLKDYYEDTTEDAYLMQFRYRPSQPDILPFPGVAQRRLAG